MVIVLISDSDSSSSSRRRRRSSSSSSSSRSSSSSSEVSEVHQGGFCKASELHLRLKMPQGLFGFVVDFAGFVGRESRLS